MLEYYDQSKHEHVLLSGIEFVVVKLHTSFLLHIPTFFKHKVAINAMYVLSQL